MSLKKIDYANNLVKKWKNKLSCPYCGNGFELVNSSLMCSLGHQFDISKQGVLVLLKTNLKEDKLYSRDLFMSRRRIMLAGLYRSVYPHFENYMNDSDFVLDMGSGEATHDMFLSARKSIHIMGVDLAKEGVRLASDFLQEGVLSVVADLSHLPISDGSINVILNILSPSNEAEMHRILKSDGLVLKVVPRENYLIELRKSVGLGVYEALEPDFKHFTCVERIPIKDTFQLNADLFHDLVNMTPLSNHKGVDGFFDEVTIDLELWVLRKND